jgi:hypothetical protein
MVMSTSLNRSVPVHPAIMVKTPDVLGTKKPTGLWLPTVTWSDVVKNVTTLNRNETVLNENIRMSQTETGEKHSE